MQAWLRAVVVVMALAASASGAMAGVTYTFNETVNGSQGLQGVLTVPTSITADTTFSIPSSALTLSRNPAGFNTLLVEPDSNLPFCSFDFNRSTCDLLVFEVEIGGGLISTGSDYGFALNTFASPGQLTATDGVFSLSLTVAQTTVPEPITLTLLGSGVAGVIVASHRRRRPD